MVSAEVIFPVCSRRKPMGLIVALDDDQRAAGELFWDDGDSRGGRPPSASSSPDRTHLRRVGHLICPVLSCLTDTVERGAYLHYQFSASSVRSSSVLIHLHHLLRSGPEPACRVSLDPESQPLCNLFTGESANAGDQRRLQGPKQAEV